MNYSDYVAAQEVIWRAVDKCRNEDALRHLFNASRYLTDMYSEGFVPMGAN